MVNLSQPLCPIDLGSLNSAVRDACGEHAPIVSDNVSKPGYVRLGELSIDDIECLLDHALVGEPKGDRKLAAAYAIGAVSWSICLTLTALALQNRWLVGSRADAIAIRPRLQHWEANGEQGVFYLYDVAVDPNGIEVALGPADDQFTRAVEALFTCSVSVMSQQSGLSKPALWRLVADHIGEAFLVVGKKCGEASQAVDLARLIFRNRNTKLYNKQTDFTWVEVPKKPEKNAWMLRKGGCCRAYTITGSAEDYCASCVLRDSESQQAMFEKYLETL